MVMKKAMVAITAGSLAGCCSLTSYWGERLPSIAAERMTPAPPLAREVVWVLEYRPAETEPRFYFSRDVSHEANRAEIIFPERADARAVDLLREETSHSAASTELKDAVAHILSVQPESVPDVEKVWIGHLGETARFGLGTFAAVAALEADTSRDLQRMVDWALKDPGLVGPEAPEGSILFAFMNRSGVTTNFGWKWQQSVQLVLVRDGSSVVASRSTPFWIYKSPPASTPLGMVHSREVHAQDPSEKPIWLAKYYDTALLLRSAAHELAWLQRTRSGAGREEPRR